MYFLILKERLPGTCGKKLESLFVMFLYLFTPRKKAHNPNTQIMRFFLGVKFV